MKLYYCDNCRDDVETRVIERDEEFPVRGDPVRVKSSVRVCNVCGEDIFDEELDSRNLETAFDVYRERHDVISSSEIEALREKYGLSQRSLAALLGWGEVTVHRYESGAIPDEAHNQMLRLLGDPRNVASLFERTKDRLPAAAGKKLEARLAEILEGSETSRRCLETRRLEQRYPLGPLTGYVRFSEDVLKDMIHFFASRESGVLKTKLNKLLFYADFLHFQLHTVSISGATYVHLPYGPVPDGYERYLSSLIEDELIQPREVAFTEEITGEYLVAAHEPDMRWLRDSAKTVLNAVYEHFRHMGSKRISDLSHDEEGYRQTKPGEPISYEYADRLKVSIPVDGI